MEKFVIFCGFMLVLLGYSVEGRGKKTKCFSIPTFPMKVEDVIKSCQDEVKANLVEDLLLAAFNENPFEPLKHHHTLKQFEDYVLDGHHGVHYTDPHHHDPHSHSNDPHNHHHHSPDHHDIHHHPDPHHPPLVHYHQPNHHLHPHPDPHHLPVRHPDPHHHDPHIHHPVYDPHHHLPVHDPHHHSPTYDPHHYNPDPHTIHHSSPSHPIPLQISVSDHSAHHSLSDHYVNNHAVKSINHHPIVTVEEKKSPTPQAQPVFETHQDLTQVLPPKKPAEAHDNHQHITAILDKLRNNETDKDDSNLMWHRRISKRSLLGKWTTKKPEEEYHPTVISHEDRWLAGCLMQCVYRKNNAVDNHGYPTLDGLTDLYTAGTTEQAFFVHVMRSVDKCLKTASVKHKIYKGKVPIKGETCDVAFDVFDCVSDSITEYCS